ncbi:L-seryl-tRNA(Sec) kinase [Drosophila bipectinata]|uniref:L-seryl-tRNA(Sec) kinase n=1 Tax=Drosophila bipectinata TaxID=42026 RepID=UPI001C89F79F|nr:L-seryl-tRNA(Sec) kinase [Drosophila bipectinata]
MPRIALLALIGLPGAGKSSLCNWLVSQQSAHRGRYIVHLCYDDLLDTRLAYKDQRALVFRILQQLISAIQDAAEWPAQVPRTTSSDSSNTDYIILCDDNFYYRSMRYKLHQLSRSEGCIYGQIYVASSLSSCLQNNSQRCGNTRVPDHVIRQMQDRLELPSSAAWECQTLKICDVSSESTRLSVMGFIDTLLERATGEMPQVPVQSQPHTQSTAHQLDLLLRARIKTIMEGLTEPGEKQEASGRLNGQRKQILTHFRAEDDGMQTDLNCYVKLLN